MKIAIITAMWQRPELTDFVLSYYNDLRLSLKKTVEIGLFVAGSEGNISKNIAEKNGWNYVECPNFPVNQKFNCALRLARNFKPDAVIVVGSDDLLNANILKYYATRKDINSICFGFKDAYIYDILFKEFFRYKGYEFSQKVQHRAGEPVGTGRIFGRNILDRLNWYLWDNNIEINKSLDNNCKLRLLAHGFKYETSFLRSVKGCVLALRTKTRISNYEACIKEPLHPGKLLDLFGKTIYINILNFIKNGNKI